MNTTFSSHLGNDVGFQITVTSMTREHQVVKVWFDSACPLCSREISIMRKLDWFNKVDFVDVLSTPDCPTQREHLLERFHAQRLGGPLLRPLGEIARIPFVLRILEILYLRFLAIRPKLQIIFANRGD